MPLIFDPNSKDRNLLFDYEVDVKTFQKECFALRERLRSEMRATPENRACPEAVARRRAQPGVAMVIHRSTGDHRKFDFSTFFENGRTKEKASAMELSEQLLKGFWRLATIEEEQAELERRAQVSKEIQFKNEQELRAKELEVAGKALQYIGALTPNATKEIKHKDSK
jgi:hypothetical protein